MGRALQDVLLGQIGISCLACNFDDAFIKGSGGEGPTRSAAALILDGGDFPFNSPVHLQWEGSPQLDFGARGILDVRKEQGLQTSLKFDLLIGQVGENVDPLAVIRIGSIECLYSGFVSQVNCLSP